MKIPDKATFNWLSSAGLLGNHFQRWERWYDLKQSGYEGFVTVRPRIPWNSRYFIPSITSDFLGREMETWDSSHINAVYFQEVPPPWTHRIVNIETGYMVGGLVARYSAYSNRNLRDDLNQNGRDVSGLAARLALRRYLQEDYDTLEEIWDQHPDAIIEASRFSVPVGVFSKQLIVWECRDF